MFKNHAGLRTHLLARPLLGGRPLGGGLRGGSLDLGGALLDDLVLVVRAEDAVLGDVLPVEGHELALLGAGRRRLDAVGHEGVPQLVLGHVGHVGKGVKGRLRSRCDAKVALFTLNLKV